MTITVNGESTDIPAGSTVSQLLEILDKNPKFLAVERNLELIPRKTHSDAILKDGDRIEIVTLVGGG